jgi:hypothetical protein
VSFHGTLGCGDVDVDGDDVDDDDDDDDEAGAEDGVLDDGKLDEDVDGGTAWLKSDMGACAWCRQCRAVGLMKNCGSGKGEKKMKKKEGRRVRSMEME